MIAIEVLAQIYTSPGIHVREISRRTHLGLPSVKNQLDRLLGDGLISKIPEGRNLKFYPNMRNLYIIPYLYQIEYMRLKKLPKKVKNAVFDFLSSLDRKPSIALIFGSYAKGTHSGSSDLDILAIFDQIDSKEIEAKSRLISERHSIGLEPVYMTFHEFKDKFFDEKDGFMRGIKEEKIIVSGIEYWVMLENEKA